MKPISTKDISRFVALTKDACYDEVNKQEFRKLGRRILKAIALQMGLNEGEYDIRWNPGGIACSGDHTLHTDKIYLALHDNYGTGYFYWRTCKGRKDYTGGTNQIVSWTSLLKGGLAPLIAVLKTAQRGYVIHPNRDQDFNIDLHLYRANSAMNA